MPLTDINLSESPYFDDYDPNSQYYKFLFKPSYPVQTRELNGIQSISQSQIEYFADNIFKKGTIIDGCNFSYHVDYPYVKILDSDTEFNSIVATEQIGRFVKNDSDLQARIINAVDGFEASTPDLNTLYLSYVNSGNTGNIEYFSPNETLTIYDANVGIPKVSVIAGGIGFSNTADSLISVPAVIVTMSLGLFSNGDYIYQPSTGANLEVITATEISNNIQLLQVKPKNADLANASLNAVSWTLSAFEDVRDASSTVEGTIQTVIGNGFQGGIITNGTGKITDIEIFDMGQDYDTVPYITVRSANNLTGINALNLEARNYYSKTKIAAAGSSVGNGYAFSISEGVIYQKGFFAKVLPQTIIVEKYNSSPSNVAVGFYTREEIVTSDIDTSLLDNALGTENETAPGSDRLKLIPELIVLSTDDAQSNTEFTSIVEWSGGQPYKQNKATQYSRLGDDMAQRTFDQSGNFVIDTFQIATSSPANTDLEGSHYSIVVDPGQAYIGGYKVQTQRNYYIDVEKGTDTKIANNYISLNYGYYIRIKEVGGLFQFSTADTVDFYDTAKGFLSNNSLVTSGNTNPVGTKIGTARIRSMVLESGTAGDPNAVYRLYIFKTAMNKGKNFQNVKSIYYNGTNKGIADVVLDVNPTSGANIAVIQGAKNNSLIFNAGVESLKNSNNTNYVYRTIDQTLSFANTGELVKSIAANPDEFYPYTGNLSSSQLKDLYVVPIGNNLIQYTNLTGTVSVNTTSNVVTGTGTNFYGDFEPGDYVRVAANTTSTQIKKVTAIVNATSLRVDSAFSFANTSCTTKRTFPKSVPIPFGTRDGLTANVDVNMNILTLKLNHANGLALTLDGTSTINAAVAVNIKRTNTTSTSKTANRSKFVRIQCSNNVANNVGPWCLGVPDIFRLRGVYIGNSSVNTSSKNVTRNFYIDHNQTANFLDYGYLMMRPNNKIVLNAAHHILVHFDYFSRSSSGGYFDTVSYLGTANSTQIYELDGSRLAELTSAAASLEVPEVYTYNNDYYDLLNCLDFRPEATATVTPSSDYSLAPVNPSATLSFGNTADPANDKKFPLPDESCSTTIEHYLGRVDSVFIAGESGEIYVIKGIPDVDPRKRYEANHPKNTLKLHTISVPAYPNIPNNPSPYTTGVAYTGIFNEKNTNLRIKSKRVNPILSSYEFQLAQPMVYTNEDIANLERRIKDIEYYMGLSVLETSITNKIIPSSIDKSLNRFKFGFFADDFSTDVYSDVDNPQFAASIEVEGDLSYGISKSPTETNSNWASSDKTSPMSTALSPNKIVKKSTNRAVPPKFTWSMPHNFKNIAWIDEQIIYQGFATEEPEPVANTPVANTPVANTPVANTPVNCVPKVINVAISSTNTYYHTSSRNTTTETKRGIVSSADIWLPNNKSGTVNIYINNGESGFTEIEVYKNDTLIGSTKASSNTVVNLTANNKSFLNSSFKETGYIRTGSWVDFVRSGDAIGGSGKFSFVHNHTTGNYYKILTTLKKGAFWQYLLEAPLLQPAKKQTIIDPCVILNTVTNFKSIPSQHLDYVGTIKVLPKESTSAWACSKLFAINNIRVSAIFLTCTGLRPNTLHKFYVDGIDSTHACDFIPQQALLEALAASDNILNSDLANDPGYIAFMKLYNQAISDGVNNRLISNQEGKLTFVLFAPYKNNDDNTTQWFQGIQSSDYRTWGSSGYSTLMVKGPRSIATKLVAERKLSSTLPLTPNGNP